MVSSQKITSGKRSGSVDSLRMEIEGLLFQVSSLGESLCCVFEQDTLSTA